jgi:hypothetical protein
MFFIFLGGFDVDIYPRPYAGWHRDIFGGGKEAHHLWAQEWLKKWAEDLRFVDGSKIDLSRDVPCIRMHKKDHAETLSWGPRGRAGHYRKVQAQMLKQGAFLEAFYLEANVILNKRFPSGHNYAREIALAEAHLVQLHNQGKLKIGEAQLKEIEARQQIRREIDVRELADIRRQLPALESLLNASIGRLQNTQFMAESVRASEAKEIELLKQKITELKMTIERCHGLERQLRYEIGDTRLDRALERLKSLTVEELATQRQSREQTLESGLRETVKIIKPLTVANYRQAVDEVVVQQRIERQQLQQEQQMRQSIEEAQRQQQYQRIQHTMRPY